MLQASSAAAEASPVVPTASTRDACWSQQSQRGLGRSWVQLPRCQGQHTCIQQLVCSTPSRTTLAAPPIAAASQQLYVRSQLCARCYLQSSMTRAASSCRPWRSSMAARTGRLWWVPPASTLRGSSPKWLDGHFACVAAAGHMWNHRQSHTTTELLSCPASWHRRITPTEGCRCAVLCRNHGSRNPSCTSCRPAYATPAGCRISRPSCSIFGGSSDIIR
jgi:hypothetical protein